MSDKLKADETDDTKPNKIKIVVDIVGNLNKDDVFDRFEIMRNNHLYDCCFFNCIIYSCSKSVNGFFEVAMMLATMDKVAPNMFSGEGEREITPAHILVNFSRFDIIEVKHIENELYIKSLIKKEDFNRYCDLAKKFCKEYETVLYSCVEAFEALVEHVNSKNEK